MTPSISTLLQILYANGHEDIVALAVKLDNNIPFQLTVGEVVTFEITKNSLPDKHEFSGKSHYGYVQCPVVGINPYKLDKPYLVQLPNGKTDWYGDKSIANRDVTEILATEVPQAELAR